MKNVTKLLPVAVILLSMACLLLGCDSKKSGYPLPPERECKQGIAADSKILGFPSLVDDYKEADAVCEITIESWLSENDVFTCHSAKVDKVYKGELPDTINFCQLGSSTSPSVFPIYTHGNRLLVFLLKYDTPDYDNAYALVHSDISALYIANASDGHSYLIDYRMLFSYNTEDKYKDIKLNNVNSQELLSKLAQNISVDDELLANRLLNGEVDRFSEFGGFRVYDLNEYTSLFSTLDK